jgi:DNA-binding transcriptional MerR regulator
MKDSLSIADCSKRTGFSQRQLRNYETRGYIDEPLRIRCGRLDTDATPQRTLKISKFSKYTWIRVSLCP